jgi:hypothetical protein
MNLDIHLKIFRSNVTITIGWHWVRFFIILSAVLISTVAAYWGTSQAQLLLLGISIGIAGVLLLLQHPTLGFFVVLLGGIFSSYYGESGVNVVVFILAAMLVLWVLEMLVVKRRFEFVRSRVLLPAVILIFISLLAFGMGQIPWFLFAQQAPMDAQLGGFAIFVLSAGALILAAHRFQDEKWLRRFLWSFIILGAIYIVGRSIRLPSIDIWYNRGFAAGSMFWTWLVALALSQAVFNTQLKTSLRIGLGALVILTFYVAVVQSYDWKSGWLPPLVSMAVILGLRFKRLLIISVPIAVMTVGILAVSLIGTDEYSWGTRVDAWLIVLEISKLNPLLGLGFSNYYWYTPLFPIRGWSVSFNSHSQFVDLIAQTGIAGLIVFLWIFAEGAQLSWRLINKAPAGFAQSYSYGALAGIAGTLVAAFLVDWVLPFVYNIGFTGFRASILPWIFIGGLIALEQKYDRAEATAIMGRH